VGVCAFALGIAAVLLTQYWIAVYRATQRPPTKKDVLALRRALAAWARKYEVAKPTGKYLKRREKDLFDACAKVGLMWIAPEERK